MQKNRRLQYVKNIGSVDRRPLTHGAPVHIHYKCSSFCIPFLIYRPHVKIQGSNIPHAAILQSCFGRSL